MTSAAVLPFRRVPPTPLIQDRPSADRRSIIRYPGGHVVRIDREHVEHVLSVKAAVVDAEGE
jgi:hypothetical protein